MTEELLIGFIVKNWQYFASAIATLFIGGIGFTWFLASYIHSKEVRVLELQVDHQKEHFNQFETIMENKMQMIQFQAQMLQHKLSKDVIDSSQSSIDDLDTITHTSSLIPTDAKNEEKRDIDYKEASKALFAQADSISRIISTISHLLH